MEVIQGYRGLTIYTANAVTDELVEKVKELCARHDDWLYISFDVIGRTCHVCLANELVSKLDETYEAEIGYDHYLCRVKLNQ